MTNDWYTPDSAHILKAKKMGTWRHADAKLEAADVQKMDEMISCRLFEPIAMAEPGISSTNFLPRYRTTRYLSGVWQEILYFQTGMQLYPSMGICTTADDTPSASLYTHTMAIRTSQTPTYQGRHFERENITTAESERIDILGMLLTHHHIECSQAVPVATQSLNWSCAYTKNTATDDIASSICDDGAFKWSHFTFPTFTYNSETIEADILGWAWDCYPTSRMTTLDTTYLATTGISHYTVGRYIPPQHITVTLRIRPYGHNAFELIRVALEKYATDLDLTVVMTRTATNDLITFTHDKLYCFPYDISVARTLGTTEEYYMRMHQLNTGSCVPVVVDDYDDDYYET